MPLEKLLRHSFYNKFAVQNCSEEVANRILYIRRSSNGLGRGDVQPNVRFKSHLASQLNMGRYPVAGSGPDCKSGALQLGWFESNPAHQRF